MDIEPISLASILQGVIIIGIVWLGRTNLRTSEALVRLETILTGPSGENGVVGDVKNLRTKAHQLANDVHGIRGELQLHELRIGQLEEGKQ